MVSVLTYYFENPSLNPAFLCKILSEKNENMKNIGPGDTYMYIMHPYQYIGIKELDILTLGICLSPNKGSQKYQIPRKYFKIYI